jgi:hypothetical protein
MSQLLRAGCCCGDVEPPPPPPPCEFCESPQFWPSDFSVPFYYTVALAGWSFTLKTTYRRFDGSTFVYQDFDITVTVDQDVFEYPTTNDPCSIEPVVRLSDYSGDSFLTPLVDGLGIFLFDFGGDTCTHVLFVTIIAPAGILDGDTQWDLYGPSQARYQWSLTDDNACNTKPNQGQYEVLQVDIIGYGQGPNGFCVDVEQGCGGPIVGQACASATPVTLEVRECQ